MAVGLFYARVYHPRFPAVLKSWVDLVPLQYLGFAFYFPFGVVCGMFSRMVKASPTQLKSALPWLVLLFVQMPVETVARHQSSCIPTSEMQFPAKVNVPP